MNRRDIEEMRARLAARGASEVGESPLAVGCATALWAALILVMAFI